MFHRKRKEKEFKEENMFKNLFTVLATLTAAVFLFDSAYKFFMRNTRRYVRNDSFKL